MRTAAACEARTDTEERVHSAEGRPNMPPRRLRVTTHGSLSTRGALPDPGLHMVGRLVVGLALDSSGRERAVAIIGLPAMPLRYQSCHSPPIDGR